jgi:hypothetical protein
MYISGHLNPPLLLFLTIGGGNIDASEDDNDNTPVDNDAPNKEDAGAPKDNHKDIMSYKAKRSAETKATNLKKPPAKVALPAIRSCIMSLTTLILC